MEVLASFSDHRVCCLTAGSLRVPSGKYRAEYLTTEPPSLIRVARGSSESSRIGISFGGSIHSGGAQNRRIRKFNRKYLSQEV